MVIVFTCARHTYHLSNTHYPSRAYSSCTVMIPLISLSLYTLQLLTMLDFTDNQKLPPDPSTVTKLGTQLSTPNATSA